METRPLVGPADDDTAEIPQSVADEELYEAYLAARLEQSVETLNRAREELAGQPEDFARALQVMRRVHELRDLRDQLDAQRARLEAARSAAGITAQIAEPQQVGEKDASPAFRAAQSEQAEKIMAALIAQPRTCPSCQALLPPSTSRCHCGHVAEEEPARPHHDTYPQTPLTGP